MERRKLAILAAIVGLLGVDLYTLTRNEATPVTVAQEVERLRQDVTDSFADSTLAPTTSATAPPTTIRTTSTSAAPRRSQARPVPTTATSTTAPAPVATLLRPPVGVYRYRTEGIETLGLLGAQRRYPAETTRTVRHGQGCAWTMDIALLAEHRERLLVCSSNSVLDVTGNVTQVQWLGIDSVTELACAPAMRQGDRSARPGTASTFSCRQAGGVTFSGSITTAGTESMTVDGQVRQAWRIQIDGAFTGGTRGTVVVTELVDMENGLVLFEQRRNDLKQPSLLGEVSYHQEVTLTLTSLTPAT